MKVKKFISGFFITFVVALLANVVVSICWNYFVEGEGMKINWESSFSIAVVLAIVIPLTQIRFVK
jgi:hypothetical protein